MDRMVELKRCIALVRTPNMSDSMIRDWLAVAIAEVADLHPSAFRDGCAEARKTCRFPGEIVPTILNGKEAAWHKANGTLLAKPAEREQIEYRRARQIGETVKLPSYITPEELAELKAEKE